MPGPVPGIVFFGFSFRSGPLCQNGCQMLLGGGDGDCVMRGRLGHTPAVSGQPVSPLEAHRVIMLLRLEGLAIIPGLLQHTDLTLESVSTALANYPGIDNDPAMDAYHQNLDDLQEATTRSLRQLREQRLMLNDLLASPETISDAAWSEVEIVIKSVWPWRQDGSLPCAQSVTAQQHQLAQALREIDGQLDARMGAVQHALVKLGERLLGLNHLRLRRMFSLSAQ
jgi:hypothetical protein